MHTFRSATEGEYPFGRLAEQEYQTYFDMSAETAGALLPGLPNGAVRSAFEKLFPDAFD